MLAHRSLVVLFLVTVGLLPVSVTRAQVAVDVSGYQEECRVIVVADEQSVEITWPMAQGEFGHLVLNLKPEEALIQTMGIRHAAEAPARVLLQQVDPVVFLTVGSRQTPRGKPDDQKWQVFFDKPANRPHKTFSSNLDLQRVRVESQRDRATVTLDELHAGSFHGSLCFVFYPDCRLIHVDAVLRTEEDRLAIIYDAGLLTDRPTWKNLAWTDTNDQLVRRQVDATANTQPLAVRHRAIYVETDSGSIGCFSPPHQYHFPRDWTDNFRYVWYGRNHCDATDRFGFGVRQDEFGGKAFVPWFNAPPGVDHHLSVFYVLASGSAEDARRETLRFTNGDRFPALPGYLTMTSHWHMAIAVEAMQQRQRGVDPLPIPEFVKMFKDMNVNMVHLAEFHGDGHQRDPGPLRLPEMDSMFNECKRLSDDELLLIPGEEVNTFLGLSFEGKHPGHWMSLFPRPVYWTMNREADQPFVEEHEPYGKVYHVGSRADMVRLVKEENALVWAAHPRIKASSWTPDIFRHEDFFIADFWLGGAWKHMPGDLSQPRLGQHVLDLLDDMANWGNKKYVLGEVDVFKLDHTHELYGHMNINYVRLARLPRYDEGWQAVLDSLRDGKFFVTTGEILIPHFRVGGKTSGENLEVANHQKPELRAELRWTFPLKWAEVISGDGERVYRERIDLSDTSAHGKRTITLTPNLRDRHWVRFEAWDVAGNGAFTQPIWLTR